jgi:hypothetical protein
MKLALAVVCGFLYLQNTAKAADSWPSVTAGKILEVKSFTALPTDMQLLPSLQQCKNNGCELLVTRFYRVDDVNYALVPLPGLFENAVIFQYTADGPSQISFPIFFSSVGFTSSNTLGETEIDPKTGKLKTILLEDSCNAKTTTSEFTYEFLAGSYYLILAREGIGCDKPRWKTAWARRK